MKLGTKLKISFVIIAVLPILLLVSVFAVLGTWQMKEIQNNYDMEVSNMLSLTNPVRLFVNMSDSVFAEIKETVANDVDMMESKEYIEDINSKLKSKYSFIVVTKNDELVYQGCDYASDEDVMDVVPTYEDCISQ